MNTKEATFLVKKVLGNTYNEDSFREFIYNIFNDYEALDEKSYMGLYIRESFREHIVSYKRIAKYKDAHNQSVDVLVVCVKNAKALERARTMQRNFISWYLNGGRRDILRDSALVAFYSDDDDHKDWRLSLVKMDYSYDKNKNRIKKEFTPARRFSFLVGASEQIHTACKRFLPLLIADGNPTLSELEDVFNIEKVSNEFFEKYKELFLQLVETIDRIRERDVAINTNFVLCNLPTPLFCKKLLGQIVFLYFLQKKDWLGVPKDSSWGMGDKRFLRTIFNQAKAKSLNYFNDYLEHLFYEALAIERKDIYFVLFDCRIPFLNGGLFEPVNDYNWRDFGVLIPNELFSNNERTPEGDIGSGILDVFDRYNFTVREDEDLEKEVAVDPEMLGKVFENLLEVNDRKSKGAFYTPREIVHYMCQESLINYLYNKLNTLNQEFIEKN